MKLSKDAESTFQEVIGYFSGNPPERVKGARIEVARSIWSYSAFNVHLDFALNCKSLIERKEQYWEEWSWQNCECDSDDFEKPDHICNCHDDALHSLEYDWAHYIDHTNYECHAHYDKLGELAGLSGHLLHGLFYMLTDVEFHPDADRLYLTSENNKRYAVAITKVHDTLKAIHPTTIKNLQKWADEWDEWVWDGSSGDEAYNKGSHWVNSYGYTVGSETQRWLWNFIRACEKRGISFVKELLVD